MKGDRISLPQMDKGRYGNNGQEAGVNDATFCWSME